MCYFYYIILLIAIVNKINLRCRLQVYKKISVACAEDAEVMEAVENARKAGVAEAFLVGNAEKIKEVADKLGIDLANYEIVDEKGGEAAAALKAVELVSSGQAQIVMKGMVATANFLERHTEQGKGPSHRQDPLTRIHPRNNGI